MPTKGNIHVVFDPAFDDNGIIYLADDADNGTVYRNTIPSSGRWLNLDMMSQVNGAQCLNAPHPTGQFGLQIALTGTNGQTALYSAHRLTDKAHANSGVCRTLQPLNGMPKPGIVWDCLNTFFGMPTNRVSFTLEPGALKLCGCLTMDTDTVLFAIDNDFYANNHNAQIGFGGVAALRDRGMLWMFTDCTAKRNQYQFSTSPTLSKTS